MAAAPYLAEMILHDLDSCGLGSAQLVSKTDQEPAIVELQGELSRLRREITTAGTTEEHSRVGDSSPNGRVERAIQEIGGLVRTMKIALGERLKKRISVCHAVTPWIIRHACTTTNSFTVRDNGRTSHELIKGR